MAKLPRHPRNAGLNIRHSIYINYYNYDLSFAVLDQKLWIMDRIISLQDNEDKP